MAEKKQRKVRTPKTEIEKMAKDLIKVTDSNGMREFSDKFQLACWKKEMLRIQQYLDATDEVDKNVIEAMRSSDKKDLNQILEIKKVMDSSLDRYYKLMGFLKETPQNITLINNQTNTQNNTVNSFDANSRAKVRNTVSSILAIIRQNTDDVVVGEQTPPVDDTQKNPATTNTKKEGE